MIPEVLVKEHEDIYALFSEKHATVTLNHIGAAFECCPFVNIGEDTWALYSDKRKGWHCKKGVITTHELVEKYFQSIKNK